MWIKAENVVDDFFLALPRGIISFHNFLFGTKSEVKILLVLRIFCVMVVFLMNFRNWENVKSKSRILQIKNAFGDSSECIFCYRIYHGFKYRWNFFCAYCGEETFKGRNVRFLFKKKRKILRKFFENSKKFKICFFFVKIPSVQPHASKRKKEAEIFQAFPVIICVWMLFRIPYIICRVI